jgi:hypothetical protein
MPWREGGKACVAGLKRNAENFCDIPLLLPLTNHFAYKYGVLEWIFYLSLCRENRNDDDEE